MSNDFVTVKLDFYCSNKTCGRIEWYILWNGIRYWLEDGERMGFCEFIESDYCNGKTHWSEVWRVRRDVKLLRLRISNRGNVYREVVNPSNVEVL